MQGFNSIVNFVVTRGWRPLGSPSTRSGAAVLSPTSSVNTAGVLRELRFGHIGSHSQNLDCSLIVTKLVLVWYATFRDASVIEDDTRVGL